MNLKTPGAPGRGVIRGVELQDFMSYDHAEVPLVPGLNLICGPNGAGKSSLLLGISLVLGQASTERSHRLADLIRWGRPEARISLVLDNHLGDGARLFPQRKEDRVTLTRVLRRNGEYFYQVQGQAVPKADVVEALRRVGIYPDNMLIVMHQLMVHRFASVAPAEKLRMLEEAVGLRTYREEVLEALGRGRSAGEEERTLSAVLQSTQQTYDYWMKEYQRWQRKQALEARLRALEAEAAWGRVAAREAAVGRLRSRLEATRAEEAEVVQRRAENRQRLASTEALFAALGTQRREVEGERVELAREEGSLAADVAWMERLGPQADPPSRPPGESLARVRQRLAELEARLLEVDRSLEEGIGAVVSGRVEEGILAYRTQGLTADISRLEAQLRSEEEEMGALAVEAGSLGKRVEARRVSEIQAEAAATKAELGPLGHLTDEVERIYQGYMKSFEDLRAKAAALAEHRRALEAELRRRTERWRSVVEAFLADVNGDFQALLQEADAEGRAVLVEPRNIERAGLEIRVGFHAQEPLPLESFAQSGGERSVALLAFLLALQGRMASPFRALDEFDVHLDPRNRELASRMIVAQASGLKGSQYLAITPGAVEAPKGVQVIVVQNVGGTSVVREAT